MILQIDDDKLNDLMRDGLTLAIERAKVAHHTNIEIRINGQNEYYEADWLKHLQVIDGPGGVAPELEGYRPLVLWFSSEQDRQEFVAIVEEVKPGMIERHFP